MTLTKCTLIVDWLEFQSVHYPQYILKKETFKMSVLKSIKQNLALNSPVVSTVGFVPIKTEYYKRHKKNDAKMTLRISRNNTVHLSKQLLEELGFPKKVEFMYNSSLKQLLICESVPAKADFYYFNNYSQPVIHSKGLVSALNLDFTQKKSYCYKNIKIKTLHNRFAAIVQL